MERKISTTSQDLRDERRIANVRIPGAPINTTPVASVSGVERPVFKEAAGRTSMSIGSTTWGSGEIAPTGKATTVSS